MHLRGSRRRELPDELPDWEEVLADLREQQRFTLPTASQKKVPFLRDFLAWARCGVCWHIYDAHPGLTAAWRRMHLTCFPVLSEDPRHPSRDVFLRSPLSTRCSPLVCRRMVDVVWMCPLFSTFLPPFRSFEKPEGDASDPRAAYENACAQFACQNFLAGMAGGAIVVLEHPSASLLWTFLELVLFSPTSKSYFSTTGSLSTNRFSRDAEAFPVSDTAPDERARLQVLRSALPAHRRR